MMDALLTELNRSDLDFIDAPARAHQLQTLPQKRRPAAPVRDVSSWFPTEYRVAQRLIAHHLRNADPNLVALHLWRTPTSWPPNSTTSPACCRCKWA